MIEPNISGQQLFYHSRCTFMLTVFLFWSQIPTLITYFTHLSLSPERRHRHFFLHIFNIRFDVIFPDHLFWALILFLFLFWFFFLSFLLIIHPRYFPLFLILGEMAFFVLVHYFHFSLGCLFIFFISGRIVCEFSFSSHCCIY